MLIIMDYTKWRMQPQNPEDVLTHDNEREWGSWMNTFRTTGQNINVSLVPLNKIGYERYTLYFDIIK